MTPGGIRVPSERVRGRRTLRLKLTRQDQSWNVEVTTSRSWILTQTGRIKALGLLDYTV